MLAYTCTEGDEGVIGVGVSNDPVPTCETGGAWVDIYAAGNAVAEIDPALATQSLMAGFVLYGTGMALVWVVRLIVWTVKTA